MHVSSPAAVRRLISAGLTAAGLAAAATLIVPAGVALAATTTVYVSPSGTGTSCSATQPCSADGRAGCGAVAEQCDVG